MSSTGKWVNELCVYMIENYIAIKKNKLQIQLTTLISTSFCRIKIVPIKKYYILFDFTYITFLK